MAFVLLGALLIGLALGMLGSGGSAITVPVLVYLVGHDGQVSIAESLAIVGLISVAAAVPYGRARMIHWRSVIYFGIPGMAGTYVGAWLGGLASDVLQLVVFGVVLIAAAYVMFRNPSGAAASGDGESSGPEVDAPIWQVASEGSLVGALTGFVGVGGGFLIVPALVVLGHLPMRLAIGTSLVIIAAKSAVGFAKYQQDLLAQNLSVDFRTVLIFAVLGIAGSFLGRAINRRLDQQLLRRAFAAFLVLLGGFIVIREGSRLLPLSAPPAAAQIVSAGPELPDPELPDPERRPGFRSGCDTAAGPGRCGSAFHVPLLKLAQRSY